MPAKNKNFIFDVKLLKEILVFFDIEDYIFADYSESTITAKKLKKIFKKNQIVLNLEQIVNYSRSDRKYPKFKDLVVNCNRRENNVDLEKIFMKANKENNKANNILKKSKFKELDRKIANPKIYTSDSSFVPNTNTEKCFVKKGDRVIEKKNEDNLVNKTKKLDISDTKEKNDIKEVIKNRIEVLKQQYIDKKNSIDLENYKREKEARERFAKRYKAIENLSDDLSDFLIKERKKENEIKKQIKRTILDEKKKLESEYKRIFDTNINDKENLQLEFENKVKDLHESISEIKDEEFLEESYRMSMIRIEASKIEDSSRKNVLEDFDLDTTLPKFDLNFETQKLEFASCDKIIKILNTEKTVFENEYLEIKKKEKKNHGERKDFVDIDERIKDIRKIQLKQQKDTSVTGLTSVKTDVKNDDFVNELIKNTDKDIEAILLKQKEEILKITNSDLCSQRKNQLIQNSEQELRLSLHAEKAKLKNKIDYYKIQNMN